MKTDLKKSVGFVRRRFGGMFKAFVAMSAITLASVAQAANSTEVGGITWYWDFLADSSDIFIGRAANQAGVVGASGEVTVPSSLAGYNVKRIGQYAFYNCTGITKVTIPSGITAINQYAFKGCTGLTSVTIPDSVDYVGQYAFDGCSKLTEIKLPYGVTEIGNYAFQNCTSLKSAYLPIMFINGNTWTFFQGASNDREIRYCGTTTVSGRVWEYQVKKASGTGYLHTELRSLKNNVAAVSSSPVGGNLAIPGTVAGYTVTGLGMDALHGCKMATVTIPNSVTNIGVDAFENCYNLTSVTVPNLVTELGTYAFYSCTNLTSVKLSTSLLAINPYTFYKTKIANVTIPDSVTNIANNAFNTCTSLKKADVPGRFDGKLVKANVFTGVPWDFQLVYREKVGSVVWYYNVDSSGNAWIRNGDEAAVSPTTVTSLSVPSTLGGHKVTLIHNYAFKNCTSLKTVTILEGVQQLGSCAFDGCTALTSVTMPSSLLMIGSYAFRNCTSLTSVKIPDAVTYIGDYAFYGCSKLRSAIVPDYLYNSSSVSTGNVFKNCSPSLELSYSAEAEYDGRTFHVLLTGDNVQIGNGENAAIPTSSTGEVSIPSMLELHGGSRTVNSIGYKAFYNCKNIKKVTIPSSVKSIQSYAFYHCDGLTNVSISGSGLTSIGIAAFQFCISLPSINLPSSVTSIGERAFSDCKAFSSMRIPDGVKTISQYVLWDCTNLTTVTLPYDATTIATNAFKGCSKLKTAYVPISNIDNWSTLPAFAFDGAPSTLQIKYCGKWTDGSSRTWYYMVSKVKSGSTYVNSTELRHIDGVAVVSPKPSGSIATPNSVNGYQVHSIGDYAFFNCKDMTGISFGSSVTNIGYEAFLHCYKLGSITLPSSVTGIGTYAFYDCTNMTSVTMNSTKVPSIGSYTFGNCKKLTEVRLPDTVTTISANAFRNCEKLARAYLPRAMLDTMKNGTVKEKDIFVNCKDNLYIYYGADASTAVHGQLVALPNGDQYVWYGEILPEGGMTLLKSGWPINPEPKDDVEIPTTICGETVKGLGYGFRSMKKITEVWIPKTVANLPFEAFDSCTNLTSVEVQSGSILTNIGTYAFYKCTRLTQFSIPSGVESIGSGAFYECFGLSSLTIPASVKTISGSAFLNCKNLTLSFAGSSLTSIGTYAFSGCTKQKTISLPASVTSIGDYAFKGCTALTTAYLPAAVYGIDESKVFNGCSSSLKIYYTGTYNDGVRTWQYHVVGPHRNVTGFNGDAAEITGILNGATATGSLTIPKYLGNSFDYTVVSIGPSAFLGFNMSTLSLESSFVTNIGSSAFASCTKLTSVTVPDGVTRLGVEAFRNCTSLATVSLPMGLFGKVDESDVFHGCPALANNKITYRMKDGYFGQVVGNYGFTYKVVGGKAILESGSIASAVSPKPTGSLTIPATLGGYPVVTVGSYAFNGCTGLTSVSFPSTVTEIGADAFYNCTGLKSFTVPSSVTKIGNLAFYGCSGLTSVTIPASVTTIGTYAFGGCTSLTEVTIPNSVTSLGDYAFYKCGSLHSVILPDGLRGKLGEHTFTGCPEDLIVQYSIAEGLFAETVGGYTWTYKIAGEGVHVAPVGDTSTITPAPVGIVSIPSTLGGKPVTGIDGNAFKGCTGLTGLEIPDTVTTIGANAFEGCTGLTWLTIPTGVTSIGEKAFYGCSKLNGIVIPSSVTSLGLSAFESCTSLTEITIPGSITTIPARAFASCAALTTATIQEGVTAIGESAFEGCTSLTTVSIPSTVTSIGTNAFKNCPLSAVQVPTGKGTAVSGLLTASGFPVTAGLVQEPDPGKWTVTFDGNGGSPSPASKEVTKGAAIGSLAAASRNGYSLDGWFTEKSGGVEISAETKPDSDKTYYAHWTPNKYTVTFNANGGSVSPTTKDVTYDLTYGADGALPTPVYAGHTFKGWYTKSEDGDKVTSATVVKITSAQTLFAQWTLNSHHVTFDPNGGTCATEFINKNYGETLGSDLPIPERTGYTFKGWKIDAENFLNADTPITADLSCTAQWEANKYTVTFNANGGSVSPAMKQVTYDLTYGTGGALPTPSYSGHVFQGWFTDDNVKITDDTQVKITADQTLIAQWTATPPGKHTITFDPNGGSASAAYITVDDGNTVGAALPTAERTGYEFVGWQIDADHWVEAGTVVTADIACTAQWTANKYTVTLSPEGGTVTPASASVTYDLTYGEAFGGDLPIPVYAGHSFLGWFTDPGVGDHVTAATVVKITAAQTLYAHWTVDSAVSTWTDAKGVEWSYRIVDGCAEIFNGGVSAISKTTEGAITVPASINGYDVIGIGDYAFENCNMLTGVTIPEGILRIGEYAFSNCSGLLGVSMPASLVTIEGSAFLWCSALETADVPNGVTYVGEYAFSNCGALESITIGDHVEKIEEGAFYDSAALKSVTYLGSCPTTGAAVYGGTSAELVSIVPTTGWETQLAAGVWNDRAIRTAVMTTCTVTFDATGGSVTPTSRTVEEGSAIGELPEPTRPGYDFDCWTTSDDEIVTAATPVMADITLFAHWAAKSFTVTFNANGGTDVTPATKGVVYGTQYGALPDAEYEGHTFLGWFTAKVGGELVTASTLVSIEADQTLWANWAEIVAGKHTITFDPNGGSASAAYITVDDGNAVGAALPTAERTGYEFVGWQIDADHWVEAGTVVTADIACTAQWAPKSYVVKFNACGGVVPIPQMDVVYDGTYVGLPAAIYEGHTFLGWFTAAEDGEQVTYSTIVKITAEQTLFAHWSSGSSSGGGTYIEGGYDWYAEIGGDGAVITSPDGYRPSIDSGISGVLTIPSTIAGWPVTGIGDYAFFGCAGLTRIVIPDGVTTIGEWAFLGCTSLRSVTIPASVVSIGAGAFANTSLKVVYVASEAEIGRVKGLIAASATPGAYPDVNNITFVNLAGPKCKVTFNYGVSGEEPLEIDYVIGAPVDILPSPAPFAGNTFLGWYKNNSDRFRLTADDVVEGATTFYAQWMPNLTVQTAKANGYVWSFLVNGKNATIYNNGLPAVSPMPEGHVDVPAKLDGYNVTGIGYRAFYSCDAMTSVKIPDSVTEIEAKAFIYCDSLMCAEIGKKVAAIGETAFAECRELKAVVFRGAAIPEVGEDLFDAVPDTASVYVPKSAKGWPYGTWQNLAVVRGDYIVDVSLAISGGMDKFGKVSGNGQFALGKKVTLKATAIKGYVFAGWYDEATYERVSRATSYAFTITGESPLSFVAEFVSSDEDKDSLCNYLDTEMEDYFYTFDAENDGSFELDVDDWTESRSEPKVTFKGLPTGIKYDAKTMKLAGKCTKPGIYTVTVTVTNVSDKKGKTATFKIHVPNQVDDLIDLEDQYGPFIPGVAYTNTLDVAAGWSVSGLPSGMKWTAKSVLDKAKNEVIPANSFYGAATKPGDYTVYFTKTVGNVKHTATATFVVSAFPKLTIAKDGSGSGKVTGEGAYAANKKVSLKATADKGSVFSGWYDGSELLSRAASYSYIMSDVDTELTATFITSTEDAANVSVSIDEAGMEFSPAAVVSTAVDVSAGVYLAWPMEVETLSLPTVKVSGLPSGLKFTAKDIYKKGSKTEVEIPANTIYGTPTAASKTDKDGNFIPSKVSISITTAGKAKIEYTINMTVNPMESWAVGTFNGGGDNGQLTLTVASTGKISGKYLDRLNGMTWTLSAANFDSYYGTYTATVTGKSGSAEFAETLIIGDGGDLGGQGSLGTGDVIGEFLQTHWKDEPWKTIAKPFAKAQERAYTPEDTSHSIVLKFASSGAVTLKGTFGSYTASSSATIIPFELYGTDGSFGAYIYVYFPPKTGKFSGYVECKYIRWDAAVGQFSFDYLP